MWIWIIIGVIGLSLLASVVWTLRTRAKRRAQYAEALQIWKETPPDQRLDALRPLLLRSDVHAPAWYLTGCWHLTASHPSEAARAFGMAHHADCALMTAALLTFACLKTQAQPDASMAEEIATTWTELKRFAIPASIQEGLLLDALEQDRATVEHYDSPLARLIWITLGEQPTPHPSAHPDTAT